MQSNGIDMQQEWLQRFCEFQQLPHHYQSMAAHYFLPLANELAGTQSKKNHRPLLVGINGCQGSGKSTLASLLTGILSQAYGKVVANLSIDDFYCTKHERQQMAETIHPLFLTRGVPGTHDTDLLTNTLKQLAIVNHEVLIPRFDKSIDDRVTQDQWDTLITPVDIILLEGWCVGVQAEANEKLATAINPLEKEEDPKGIWRQSVNHFIETRYKDVFSKLDLLIMLKAPSFSSVYHWRKKQEDKLRQQKTEGDQSGIMSPDELVRFINHYQRLTEHMLSTLPSTADIVFNLNDQHQIEQRVDYGDSKS